MNREQYILHKSELYSQKQEADVPIRVVQRKGTSLVTYVSGHEYILCEGGRDIT
jgi:hypothetical protein